MTSTRTSRAIAGTVTSILQYGMTILLQFLLAPVVLKVAGTEVLGAYSFLMQMVSWAALTDLGFGVAIGRYLSQSVGIDDHRKRFRDVFTTGRTFYIISNAVFSILLLIISWQLEHFISMAENVANDARIALVILSIWVIIRTPLALYTDALTATQNLVKVNIISGISAVVRLILSICLVLLGSNLIGLMLANIIAEMVTYLLGYFWYRKINPLDKFGWGVPNKPLFREMLTFGFSYMIVMIAGRLSANTDSLILGYLYGATAVSIYYTSQMPGTMLYQLIWKLVDNSAPALNELHARNAVAQITSVYLRLLRYSLILVIPLAIGLVAYNRYAITLWVGETQYGGDYLTIGLAVFAITQVIIHLNCIFMVAYGDIKVMSVFFLISGVLKVFIAYWFGRLIGLQGIMLANAFVDLFAFVYFDFRVRNMLLLSFKEVFRSAILPSIISSLLPLLVLFFTILMPPSYTWIELFIWISIFGICWAIGTISVGLSSLERNQIRLFIETRLKLSK